MALPATIPTDAEALAVLLSDTPESKWPTVRERLLAQMDDPNDAKEIYGIAVEEARLIPRRRELRTTLEGALTDAVDSLAAAEEAVTGLRSGEVFDLWYSDYADRVARDLLHVLTDAHRLARIADAMRRDVEGAKRW